MKWPRYAYWSWLQLGQPWWSELCHRAGTEYRMENKATDILLPYCEDDRSYDSEDVSVSEEIEIETGITSPQDQGWIQSLCPGKLGKGKKREGQEKPQI